MRLRSTSVKSIQWHPRFPLAFCFLLCLGTTGDSGEIDKVGSEPAPGSTRPTYRGGQGQCLNGRMKDNATMVRVPVCPRSRIAKIAKNIRCTVFALFQRFHQNLTTSNPNPDPSTPRPSKRRNSIKSCIVRNYRPFSGPYCTFQTPEALQYLANSTLDTPWLSIRKTQARILQEDTQIEKKLEWNLPRVPSIPPTIGSTKTYTRRNIPACDKTRFK